MLATTIFLATGFGFIGIQDTTPQFHWSEVMPAGSTIEVRGVIGGIRAEAVSGREVTVEATRQRGRHGIPEDVEIRVFRDSGSTNVLICAVYPRGRWDDGGRDTSRDPCEAARRRRTEGGDNDTRVDYLVKVPAGIHFVGQTVTDDVIVTGLRGAAEGYSIAGDVTMRDVKGSVIDAASISGNLRFQQVDAPAVYGGTLSGDVSFAGVIHRQGDYDLLSHTGEIAVDVPRGADVSLEVWASGGDLHSVIPLARRPQGRHRFAGKQGDGSAKMSLTSLNGEVHILAPPR
jgi:hypothetical protein